MKWLDNIIIRQILKRIRKEIKMKGWMTKVGGVGMILTALGLGIKKVVDGDFSNIEQITSMFSLGMAALGIGRKIDKNTDAVKEANRSLAVD